MTTITLVSKIIAHPSVEAILLDAMHSATKVFNGMIWHLRKQYEETGKAPISRKNLNKIMKELPRRKENYSQMYPMGPHKCQKKYLDERFRLPLYPAPVPGLIESISTSYP